MKYFTFFLVSIILSGCTVGRYVTNVSSRGPGKIAIENIFFYLQYLLH
jgi:hypothetical protein